MDGVRITDTKNWSNRLCPEIKSTDKGQTFICATAHMNMASQARETRKPVIEECDGGREVPRVVGFPVILSL